MAPARLLRQAIQLVVLGVLLAIGVAACSGSAQISMSDIAAPTSSTESAGGSAAGGQPQPLAPGAPATNPAGFAEREAESYRVAIPAGWTTLTDVAELDAQLGAAASSSDIPAAAIESYRALLARGDGLVALGPGGDNFNAFRQPGTAAELGDAEALGREVENQFKTFAQDVSISAAPRFLGDLAGLMTTGQYSLNGQQFYLYQFATAHEDHVYFMTVTLLTGPDQELADQILGSIAFE